MDFQCLPPGDPSLGPAATPIAFIRAMVQAYGRYGRDPGQALALARIPPALLTLPNARVTATQMEMMSAVAMQELDDEALGWFSRRLPWGSYGMLCRASLTAPNLGVALKRWCRHHRLLTQDIRLELQEDAEGANLSLNFDAPPPATAEMRELCLVTSLRYLLGYACWAIDSRIPLLEAAFSFAPPPHQDAYAWLFSGPVRFDAAWTGVRFDRQYLNLPLRRDESNLQQMLKRALPLTVLQYRRDRLLVQKVRQLLATESGQGHTAESVAARLHVSVRTLHRQLREEGASLLHLKDQARRDLALDLLQRTRRPIKQVAQAVGYRNEKSFIRAFRDWTGTSPGAYRAGDDLG